MENNKNKKSVKYQVDMLNFYDFIQVFVFTTNHHLNTSFISAVKLTSNSAFRNFILCMIDSCNDSMSLVVRKWFLRLKAANDCNRTTNAFGGEKVSAHTFFYF